MNRKAVTRTVVTALFLAILTAWAIMLGHAASHRPSSGDRSAFGDLTALLVLSLFTLSLYLFGARPRALVIGVDNRYSTSKIQVWMWTYAIGGALIALIADTWVGSSKGFDAVTSPSFAYGDYLALLGAPYLAALAARGIVGSQVADGSLAKPPAETPALSQIFTDDNGDSDLVDCQFLLFNTIALVYFLGAFVPHTGSGLPNIPTILFVLSGASSLAYTGNKAIIATTPSLQSISPAKGPPGSDLRMFGSWLLFPKDPENATSKLADYLEIRVLIGGLEAGVLDGTLNHAASGDDQLSVRAPEGLAAGQTYDVVVLNFRGTQSTGSVQFQT